MPQYFTRCDLLGADVNPVDRFGNTPLMDARRSFGRNHQAVEQILEEHGGTISSKGEYQTIVSIKQSLPLLCARGNFGFAEAFLEASGRQAGDLELNLVESFVVPKYASKVEDIQKKVATRVVNSQEIVSYVNAMSPQVIESPGESVFGNRVSSKDLQAAGLSSAVIIPFKETRTREYSCFCKNI